MEQQIITITIKTKGEECVMNDDEIKEWYRSHVTGLFNLEYGTPEIEIRLERIKG